jgi:hypothetical protein
LAGEILRLQSNEIVLGKNGAEYIIFFDTSVDRTFRLVKFPIRSDTWQQQVRIEPQVPTPKASPKEPFERMSFARIRASSRTERTKSIMLDVYRHPRVKDFTTNTSLMRKAGISNYKTSPKRFWPLFLIAQFQVRSLPTILSRWSGTPHRTLGQTGLGKDRH